MPRACSTTVAAIEARQRSECAMREFDAARAAEARERTRAEWQLRGKPQAAQRALLRQLDVVEAQHRDVLVARRERLTALLQREAAQHAAMLSGLTESDAQRRERLIRNARELRERREAAKQRGVAVCQDKLLREKMDCLRQAESRLKVMQATDERYAQLDALQQRRLRERDEEAFYVQQAAEAQRVATERAQRDLEARHAHTQRLRADLAVQVEGNAMRAQLDAQAAQRERDEEQRLLHEEQTLQAQRAAEARARRVALGAEMRETNAQLQRARQQEYAQLRAEDKATLDALLAEAAAEEQRQREEKQARRAAMQASMRDAQAQMQRCKAQDDALEQMWHEASEREWAKREAVWRAQQAQRDALLRSVLIARREQVLAARQRARDDAAQLQREHAAFLASLSDTDALTAHERQRRLALLAETQRCLDAQVAERRAAAAAAAAAARHDAAQQAAALHESDVRVADELRKLEAAKPARFRDVPLLPPQHRLHA